MTDKELLELAAKAAGVDYGWQYIFDDYEGSTSEKWNWNPLTDDGDALRLAVKLELFVDAYDKKSTVCRVIEPHNGDPYAATRRAIVRAAAEVGKDIARGNT